MKYKMNKDSNGQWVKTYGRDELNTKEANPYRLCLMQSLKQYTLDSNWKGIWTLTYCLTYKGREDMRRRNILQMNPKENK